MNRRARFALAALLPFLLLAACGLVEQQSTPAPPPATAAPTIRSVSLPPEPAPSATPVPLAALAVEAEIPLGATLASEIGIAEDALWVGTNIGLARVDPATNQVTVSVELFGGARRLAVGFGSVWVPDFEANLVRRVDLASAEEIGAVPVGANPEDVVVTADSVWVANHRGGTVSRIDPEAMAVAETIELAPAGAGGPQSLFVLGDAVWVSVPSAFAVVRIDPGSGTESARVGLERAVPCGAMAAGGDGLWVTSCADSTFAALIDPTTAALVAEIDLGTAAGEPFALDGDVWVPLLPPIESAEAATLTRPALEGALPGFMLAPARTPFGAAVAFGSLWISDLQTGRVIRHALPSPPGG